MTPAEINTAIRNRYNAVGDTFFNDQMVYDIIYQACLEMATESNVIESTYSTTSTAATRTYAFPTTAISIRRVEYDGDKVLPVSVDEDPKTSTTEVSGRPTEYAVWDNEIVFYPTPDVSALTINIHTYNEPQPITASSTLEVPSEYHMMIVDLGLSIFYAKDGNIQMSQYHEAKWQGHMNKIKRSTAKKKRGDAFVVVKDEETTPFRAHNG
jgi:hypothetical protein